MNVVSRILNLAMAGWRGLPRSEPKPPRYALRMLMAGKEAWGQYINKPNIVKRKRKAAS